MTFYSVLDVMPSTNAWIPTNRPIVNKLIPKYGSIYLATTTNNKQIKGEKKDAAIHIIILWPTEEDD